MEVFLEVGLSDKIYCLLFRVGNLLGRVVMVTVIVVFFEMVREKRVWFCLR